MGQHCRRTQGALGMGGSAAEGYGMSTLRLEADERRALEREREREREKLAAQQFTASMAVVWTCSNASMHSDCMCVCSSARSSDSTCTSRSVWSLPVASSRCSQSRVVPNHAVRKSMAFVRCRLYGEAYIREEDSTGYRTILHSHYDSTVLSERTVESTVLCESYRLL